MFASDNHSAFRRGPAHERRLAKERARGARQRAARREEKAAAAHGHESLAYVVAPPPRLPEGERDPRFDELDQLIIEQDRRMVARRRKARAASA
jgi:hypothetical protein